MISWAVIEALALLAAIFYVDLRESRSYSRLLEQEIDAERERYYGMREHARQLERQLERRGAG